ncbi:hypothetical protein QUF50_08160 [Thiotrichales bacterium HSG1]|nr:hypothetical protein [Thiotrichales bacterium HSG1]
MPPACKKLRLFSTSISSKVSKQSVAKPGHVMSTLFIPFLPSSINVSSV